MKHFMHVKRFIKLKQITHKASLERVTTRLLLYKQWPSHVTKCFELVNIL